MTYRNLMLTMLLGGLWHGANWTFVVWGAIHGAGLAVERLFTRTFGEFRTQKLEVRSEIPAPSLFALRPWVSRIVSSTWCASRGSLPR